MRNDKVVQEIADKMSNMLQNLIYSNAQRIYDDLYKMAQEEKKAAQIVLKPEMRAFMDTDGIIDLNAKIAWKYELSRSDRVESVHIDPLQITMDFGDGGE